MQILRAKYLYKIWYWSHPSVYQYPANWGGCLCVSSGGCASREAPPQINGKVSNFRLYFPYLYSIEFRKDVPQPSDHFHFTELVVEAVLSFCPQLYQSSHRPTPEFVIMNNFFSPVRVIAIDRYYYDGIVTWLETNSISILFHKGIPTK